MHDYNYNSSIFTLENYVKSDIGVFNAINILNICQSMGNNNIFVDLGVWHGFTSHILLIESQIRNNKVYGVDVKFDETDKSLLENPNYQCLLGDSSTIGKRWTNGPVSVLFIDTIHVKEHVICELCFWYDHVKEGGTIILHDTSWPDGVYDTYWGVRWDRPEDAIKIFFGVSSLNYEDEYIKMTSNDDTQGMTFINIKKKFNYKDRIEDLTQIFNARNFVTGNFNYTKLPGYIYERF